MDPSPVKHPAAGGLNTLQQMSMLAPVQEPVPKTTLQAVPTALGLLLALEDSKGLTEEYEKNNNKLVNLKVTLSMMEKRSITLKTVDSKWGRVIEGVLRGCFTRV